MAVTAVDVAVDVVVDVEADGCFRCILSLKLPSFVGNFRLNRKSFINDSATLKSAQQQRVVVRVRLDNK